MLDREMLDALRPVNRKDLTTLAASLTIQRHVSMFDIHLSKNPIGVLAVLDMPESKGNDRADRLAGKATIKGGLRLGISEVLRSLRHYLCCPNKARDITPSIAWRREAKKEEELNKQTLSSSIRPTLELFQGQHWVNSRETGWSACGPSRAHRYHLELN